MKVLVTGAKGFVGRNLVADLSRQEDIEMFEFDLDTSKDKLTTATHLNH